MQRESGEMGTRYTWRNKQRLDAKRLSGMHSDFTSYYISTGREEKRNWGIFICFIFFFNFTYSKMYSFGYIV